MFFRFVTKYACDKRTDGRTDRQTDRQTEGQNYDPQDPASIAASRGKNSQTHSFICLMNSTLVHILLSRQLDLNDPR